jgi:hypothetical protein
MQTFLPLPGYAQSAAVLDNKRLGKQRVECKQILRALGVRIGSRSKTSLGWRNHPAVRMWRTFEYSLCCYAIRMCEEWRKRGFKDTLLPQFEKAAERLYRSDRTARPAWIGDPAFHASHRSNLLRKDPAYYARFGWSEPDDLPYVWPVEKGDEVAA